MMKTYLITFTTLDGNTNMVFIDGISKRDAIKEFEGGYQFDEIKDCESLGE